MQLVKPPSTSVLQGSEGDPLAERLTVRWHLVSCWRAGLLLPDLLLALINVHQETELLQTLPHPCATVDLGPFFWEKRLSQVGGQLWILEGQGLVPDGSSVCPAGVVICQLVMSLDMTC